MKVRLPFAMTVFTLALCACSNGDNNAPAAPPPVVNPPPTLTGSPNLPNSQMLTELQYEYKMNDCSTGAHKFSTKKDYCDALLNDSLNNSCARELRVQGHQYFCTGAQQASNPGALSPMTTARCVVNGMDLKDRTFLENLNPFNPQRRQSFQNMFWDGKQARSFDVLTLGTNLYGKVRLALTPAQAPSAANGQIQLLQQRGNDAFSVRSNLGTKFSLLVTNYETEKEVEAVCVSEKVFKLAKRDLSQVRCKAQVVGSSGSPQEEILAWDTKTSLQKELFRGRHNEKISVRLNPAQQGEEESIQIEAEVGFDKTMKAESTLNEGLEVRYHSRNERSEVLVNCEPASK